MSLLKILIIYKNVPRKVKKRGKNGFRQNFHQFFSSKKIVKGEKLSKAVGISLAYMFNH